KRFYQGAGIPFEEHFYISLKPAESDLFPGGASLFYYTGDGEIRRLTMGRLGGSHEPFRAWEIELKPTYAPSDHSQWKVIQWPDAWGHTLKIITPSVPEKWDGHKLDASELFDN